MNWYLSEGHLCLCRHMLILFPLQFHTAVYLLLRRLSNNRVYKQEHSSRLVLFK